MMLLNNVVYYSQEDKRWKNTPFTITGDKTQTIGTSGCGPTSIAMIVSTLTGIEVLPTSACSYAISKGYRTKNDGTAWGFFNSFAKSNGLECKQTSKLDEVKQALFAGQLVVASMGKGNFTGGGHYIVLSAINGEWITVLDPNHDNTKYGKDGKIIEGVKNDGIVEAHESVFKAQAKQYWIISAPKKEVKAKMTPEDANKIIAFLSAAWNATTDVEAKAEFNRLANELRKASGQAVK